MRTLIEPNTQADSDGKNRTIGYEKQDAKYFASLGANWVKVDALKMPRDPRWTQSEVQLWRDGIDQAGRHGTFFFSNCHCGCMSEGDARRGGFKTWCSQLTDMWRTSNDISPDWEHVMHNLDSLIGISHQAGPGKGWNDPDILEIGVNNPVWDKSTAGLTLIEGTTHFALWCVTSAPLLLGFDATHVSDDVLAVVTNKAAILVNQQWAGSAGDRVWQNKSKTGTTAEMWAKPQPGGAQAFVLFNRGGTPLKPFSLPLHMTGFAGNSGKITDVWTGKGIDQPVSTRLEIPALAPHQCIFWQVNPI